MHRGFGRNGHLRKLNMVSKTIDHEFKFQDKQLGAKTVLPKYALIGFHPMVNIEKYLWYSTIISRFFKEWLAKKTLNYYMKVR